MRNSNLKYQLIPDEEVFKYLEEFEEQFGKFIRVSGYPDDIQYYVSRYDLIDIIIRVDKRKAYFYCFHGMEINARKQAALYVYWILKFKPFKITDIRYLNKKNTNSVNEAFAIYMICSILFSLNRFSSSTASHETFYQKLLYAFRFRDFSIEALMLLVEALNTETFDNKYVDSV